MSVSMHMCVCERERLTEWQREREREREEFISHDISMIHLAVSLPHFTLASPCIVVTTSCVCVPVRACVCVCKTLLTQPVLSVLVPKAFLVPVPGPVEVNRTIHPPLDHLRTGRDTLTNTSKEMINQRKSNSKILMRLKGTVRNLIIYTFLCQIL